MSLKRTKLLGIQAIIGINTVGILTVGVTQTAGGVGIASTTYLRGVIMHNTGLGTCTSSLYIYPTGTSTPVTDCILSSLVLLSAILLLFSYL